MTRAFIRPYSMAAVAGLLALTSACTMKNQEAPPLTGPSEFDLSVTLAASPDQLQQDGASASRISVKVRDINQQPKRNLPLHVAMRVQGTLMDFGSLSARSIYTDNNGEASTIYTAPSSPASGSTDPFTVVDILVTPEGSDFANTTTRIVSIRLYPVGPVVPGFDLQPAFTVTPGGPTANQNVLFDASSSQGSIVSYQWNFGDGERKSGRTVQHDFAEAGTYIVTLTVADPYGRTASTSQSVSVSAGDEPTAIATTSPSGTAFRGQTVQFNASQSRAAAGRKLVSYSWDFGDGTSGSGITTSHVYPVVGTYTITLNVTDDAGRVGTFVITIGVVPPTP